MTTSHFLSENAQVDTASVKGFPSSHKIYVQGSRADIQVPMRAIHLDRQQFGWREKPTRRRLRYLWCLY